MVGPRLSSQTLEGKKKQVCACCPVFLASLSMVSMTVSLTCAARLVSSLFTHFKWQQFYKKEFRMVFLWAKKQSRERGYLGTETGCLNKRNVSCSAENPQQLFSFFFKKNIYCVSITAMGEMLETSWVCFHYLYMISGPKRMHSWG